MVIAVFISSTRRSRWGMQVCSSSSSSSSSSGAGAYTRLWSWRTRAVSHVQQLLVLIPVSHAGKLQPMAFCNRRIVLVYTAAAAAANGISPRSRTNLTIYAITIVVVVVEVRRIRHRRNDQPHARVDPHDGWFT